MAQTEQSPMQGKPGSDNKTIVVLITNPDKCLLESETVGKAMAEVEGNASRWLAEGEACEFSVQSAPSTGFVQRIRAAMGDLPIDIACVSVANRRKKVLIADMDSTMIDQECIDELAAEVGVKDRVAAITAAAMNGEIEFEPALRERVALLAGLPETIADEVIEKRITLAAGGRQLIATMKAHGNHCALVSGGFTLFTSRIAATLGFDENHANILEVENGKLTGSVREPILGAAAKVEALERIAAARSLSPADFVAVGDGANDLPMLQLAGMGVALHAKPSVAAKADIRIDHGDLTALLYLQGYSRDEFAL